MKSQFHFGSIQTDLVIGGNSDLVESQFHFGSIQTDAPVAIAMGHPIYRLNSTLVQFKLNRREVFNKLQMKSQFHFGSIQTGVRVILGRNSLQSVSIPLWFNSNGAKNRAKVKE